MVDARRGRRRRLACRQRLAEGDRFCSHRWMVAVQHEAHRKAKPCAHRAAGAASRRRAFANSSRRGGARLHDRRNSAPSRSRARDIRAKTVSKSRSRLTARKPGPADPFRAGGLADRPWGATYAATRSGPAPLRSGHGRDSVAGRGGADFLNWKAPPLGRRLPRRRPCFAGAFGRTEAHPGWTEKLQGRAAARHGMRICDLPKKKGNPVWS